LKEQSRTPQVASYVQYTSQDGRPYYYNTATGLTQWEAPKEVVVPPPKFPGHSQGPAGCNLFVFHLPIEWLEPELVSYFAPFGNVISSRIMCDKTTGKSKGYGFISYDNQLSAVNAVRMMNGFQVGNKRLKVQIKKGEDSGSSSFPPFSPYPSYHEPYSNKK
jgi:CUG-BP- and ETR3-like factor